MKKVSAIICVVLLIVIALIIACNIMLNSFRVFLMDAPNIINEVVSPDGKFVACVFESNAGATTRFTYRLSILKNGKKLKAGDIGNTFITYDEFDVEWVDDNTLMVNNVSTVNIFEQKLNVNGVKVNYKFMRE